MSPKGQDKLGELMTAIHKREVYVREHDFGGFQGAWLTPKDKRRTGVVLYLHGGGYTCGNLDYAKGFAATLADECGVRVFCAAYRLAPEDPFPAALDDAVVSYQYLLSKGYGPNQILLCGESAGGGLCYALCLRLKQLKLPLPCGIIAIFAVDGSDAVGRDVRRESRQRPVAFKELLDFYSACYTQNPKNPLCSPLFGNLKDLPPSLLFAGGDEILLDDAQRFTEAAGRRLQEQTLHCARALARVRVILPCRKYAGRFRVHQSLFRQDAFSRQRAFAG